MEREVGRRSELARSDADERVRRQAIRDLAVMARDVSRNVFTQALADPSPAVRREAEQALRSRPVPPVVMQPARCSRVSAAPPPL
ncbi:MAG TPA: hypothetical protein DCM87_11030 [Planctomycetes bacterium]|nr:hypothetical protein [Planctomycetota bacterium]